MEAQSEAVRWDRPCLCCGVQQPPAPRGGRTHEARLLHPRGRSLHVLTLHLHATRGWQPRADRQGPSRHHRRPPSELSVQFLRHVLDRSAISRARCLPTGALGGALLVTRPWRTWSHGRGPFSAGQGRHPGAVAQRLEGVGEQGALQCGLRGVSHRALGLARSLAPALQPAHGDAGERGPPRRPRSHARAHRYQKPPHAVLGAQVRARARAARCAMPWPRARTGTVWPPPRPPPVSRLPSP